MRWSMLASCHLANRMHAWKVWLCFEILGLGSVMDRVYIHMTNGRGRFKGLLSVSVKT